MTFVLPSALSAGDRGESPSARGGDGERDGDVSVLTGMRDMIFSNATEQTDWSLLLIAIGVGACADQHRRAWIRERGGSRIRQQGRLPTATLTHRSAPAIPAPAGSTTDCRYRAGASGMAGRRRPRVDRCA